MGKRTSDYYSSDTEQMISTEDIGSKTPLADEYRDIFLMRPLVKDNSGDSFKEAMRLYDTGSEEVQQLLLRECSLIFECRMCRNMFRSLKQFIGHKREFCRSAVSGNRDKAEGDKYNGFSKSNVNVSKQICNDNTSNLCVSVLPTTDEAVQQTRTLCESNELIAGKKPGPYTKPSVEQNDDEKIKNILACPQENCMLNFSTTKDLELHFSQDHIKTIVFPTFCEQKIEQQTQTMPEATTQTRAKCLVSNNVHSCDHCGKTFECMEALSTHLMHCPVKHNILSKTLAAAAIEMSTTTKRIKLQASAESSTEEEPVAEICNSVANNELENKVTTQALVTDNADLRPNVIVKQEYVAQESSTSNNTNVLIKKRKLKNRRVLGSKMTAETGAPQITQEICSAKIKSEYSAGSDGSDVEPKKLLSTCTYCGKSFERRAALSTHLQHCPVKYSVLEKSTIYGMPTCTKRLKLHSVTEKTLKDTRQQNGTSNIAEDPDTELLNEMFANLGRQDFGVGLQTVTIEQDDSTVSGAEEAKQEEDIAQMENVQFSTPTKECAENLSTDQNASSIELSTSTSALESSPDANEEDTDKKSGRRVRLAPLEKRLLCRCKICYKQFNALSNLRRHISMFHYRAQRFGCTLCEYRAFRRYDIVNHLGNTHGMQGDPEAMSIEFVSEHEVNYSREDVEGDIVVLDESKNNLSTLNELNEDVENSIETRQNLKRLKRNKTTPVSSELAATITKVTRPKIRRSQSQQETSVAGGTGGIKTPARRPIRNRIKPENKDFVYDLSTLSKNENATDAQNDTTTRNLRRRQTMQVAASEVATQRLEPLLGPVSTWAAIRGATQRLAASIVSSGCATSATQPELPAERPKMRQRMISAQRPDTHAVPIIEGSDLEAARLQSTLLEDTFLEKVTKASPTNFRIKPSLTLHTSTLNWLLEKVDSSLHQQANGKAPSPSASLKCSDGNIINKLQVSPPPSIPRANAPPPTPRKRLSMLDRLRDDTFKYRDSLLRTALEN